MLALVCYGFERIASDKKDGGIKRMSDPLLIKEIQDSV